MHWHVVPLPPGVPYADQQLGLVDLARLGVPATDPAPLAATLRDRLADAPWAGLWTTGAGSDRDAQG